MIIKVKDSTGLEKLAVVLDLSSTAEEALCMQNSILWLITAASQSDSFSGMESELRYLLELVLSLQPTLDQASAMNKMITTEAI